jgi:hypothetical protein
MKIQSGSITNYVYFVAVDATDLKTRETGLSSFTVYRSRNGTAAAAMTTPTINEVDSSNMPGGIVTEFVPTFWNTLRKIDINHKIKGSDDSFI